MVCVASPEVPFTVLELLLFAVLVLEEEVEVEVEEVAVVVDIGRTLTAPHMK